MKSEINLLNTKMQGLEKTFLLELAKAELRFYDKVDGIYVRKDSQRVRTPKLAKPRRKLKGRR